jgi:hypothetical protein
MDHEELWRSSVSSDAAHSYLIGFLLRTTFKDLDANQIGQVAKIIKDHARQTPPSLTGATAGDEVRSERLADLIVRMQQQVDKIVDEAATAAAAVANNLRRGQ